MLRTTVLAFMAALSCHSSWAQSGPVQRIQVRDLSRTYVVDRFQADRAQGRLPIVIYLHGLGNLITEAVPARFDIPFAAQPDMEPALIVRPQGVDRRWDSKPGRISTWTRLAGTDGEPVDDIAFLRVLIDHLVADENGDPDRVYVVGVSGGGYLAARVACEMGDKVAAVADIIATSVRAVFQDCNPRAVPFALVVSTTDDVDPYAGQRGDELTALASAPETAFFFARHNGCSARSETPLPHTADAPASTVSLIRFSACRDDAEVWFYRVDGSGHSVPSTAPIGTSGWEASGRRNRDIETAAVLWAFFRNHRLTPARTGG